MVDLGPLSIEARCDYWRESYTDLVANVLRLRQKYIDLVHEQDVEVHSMYSKVVDDLSRLIKLK